MKRQRAARWALLGLCAVLGAWPWRHSLARHRRVAKPPVRHMACEPFVAIEASRVAKAGDTLWSLTAEVTQKPWVWPQIWALNPELENPHWLMVGQTVHFAARPHGRRVRVASHMPEAMADGEDALARSEEDDGAAGQIFEEGEAPRAKAVPPAAPVASPAPWEGRQPPPGLRHAPLLAAALFDRHEAKRFGTLVGSSAEGLLWEAGERVRMRWPKGVDPGPGPWAVVRTSEGPDRYAESAPGVVAMATGIVEPLGSAGPGCGRIAFVREEVEAGQRLVPLSQMVASEPPLRAAPATLCASIVALEHAALSGNPLHLVLIDRGERDGLGLGSVLQGEATGRGHDERPQFVVVRLGEKASTARPLRANQELVFGQRLCGVPKDARF